MFTLHYAHIDSKGEIPKFEFDKHLLMVDFIDEHCYGRKGDVVWLLKRPDDTNLFVSESYIDIQMMLERWPLWGTIGDYFLQEFNSFEEAYKVALEMVEESHLCYEPKQIENK